MREKVKISFGAVSEGDPSPEVIIYNPSVLTTSLFSQVMRFGLHSKIDKNSPLSGKLKGKRSDFTQMIQSYGFNIEIVPVT